LINVVFIYQPNLPGKAGGGTIDLLRVVYDGEKHYVVVQGPLQGMVKSYRQSGCRGRKVLQAEFGDQLQLRSYQGRRGGKMAS